MRPEPPREAACYSVAVAAAYAGVLLLSVPQPSRKGPCSRGLAVSPVGPTFGPGHPCLRPSTQPRCRLAAQPTTMTNLSPASANSLTSSWMLLTSCSHAPRDKGFCMLRPLQLPQCHFNTPEVRGEGGYRLADRCSTGDVSRRHRSWSSHRGLKDRTFMFGGLSFSHHGSPLLPRPARTITSLRVATRADGATLGPHLCEASLLPYQHNPSTILVVMLFGLAVITIPRGQAG